MMAKDKNAREEFLPFRVKGGSHHVKSIRCCGTTNSKIRSMSRSEMENYSAESDA